MSIQTYQQLEVVYRQQIEALGQPQPDVAFLRQLIQRSEDLLAQVGVVDADPAHAAAAHAAWQVQQQAASLFAEFRESLRQAAVGTQRIGGALKAYGSHAAGGQSVARFIDGNC